MSAPLGWWAGCATSRGAHMAATGADRVDPPDEAGPGRVADVVPVGRAQLRDHRGPLVGPVLDRAAALGPGEAVQQRVPLGGDPRRCAGAAPRRQHSRPGCRTARLPRWPGSGSARPGWPGSAAAAAGRRRQGPPCPAPRPAGTDAGARPRRSFERPGHRLEHLEAGPDRPPLFQPGVPGHADPGQLRDSSRRSPAVAAPVAAGQPDVLRRDPSRTARRAAARLIARQLASRRLRAAFEAATCPACWPLARAPPLAPHGRAARGGRPCWAAPLRARATWPLFAAARCC